MTTTEELIAMNRTFATNGFIADLSITPSGATFVVGRVDPTVCSQSPGPDDRTTGLATHRDLIAENVDGGGH